MPTYSVAQRKEISERLAFSAICTYSTFGPSILSNAAKYARRDLNKIKKKYAKKDAVVSPCARHPRYMGHRKPVNGCKECFAFYRGLKLKGKTDDTKQDKKKVCQRRKKTKGKEV